MQNESTPQIPNQPTVSVASFGESVTRWRGLTDEIAAADLAGWLSRDLPLYLIVDLRKLKVSLQEDIAIKDILFDWLDPVAAELVSPVLVAQHESAAVPMLVSEGWYCDALIAIFSRQDKPALLSHLRHCLRPETESQGGSQGVVAYCWPSAMVALLESETADFSQQFLRGIDGVLVEVPGQPQEWQIYGGAAAAAALEQRGLAGKS